MALADQELATRIIGEYREIPGLSLTTEQATRLCGVDPGSCRMLLQRLVAEGYLRLNDHGRYVVAGGES